MRGMQRGWLGEERYFLVVPVDEDMMRRRREDVGGATLRERNNFLSFGGGETAFEEATCTQREQSKFRVSRTWVGHRSSSILRFASVQGSPQLVTILR
jgi:hypothetical protein